VPARSLVKEVATSSDARGIPQLVMSILGLPAVPSPSDGPEQIAQWDSLGTLKLLLGLEETFDVTLGEDDVKAARSVDRLSQIVDTAVRLKQGAA
jgi:acyl carrier protein